MHTIKLDNGRVFLCNGDGTGDLYINCTPDEVEHLEPGPNGRQVVRVTIPFDDVVRLVDAVRAVEAENES